MTSHLCIADHCAGNLLCASHLFCAQSTFGGEVKAQAVRSHQGATLVSLSQDLPQGKVQDVGGSVVTHDGPGREAVEGGQKRHVMNFFQYQVS